MITEVGLPFRIIAKVTWKRLLFLTTLSVGVLYSYEFWGRHIEVPNSPLAIFGTLLAILLGFRVNNAYDRWWEARKLWGKIVNDSRTVARQFIGFLEGHDPEVTRRLVYRQAGYCFALAAHLRGLPMEDDIAPFFSEEERTWLLTRVNVPNAIQELQTKDVQRLLKAGVITDFQQRLLEERFGLFLDSQGGCERIKKTVFPHDYRYYTTLFINVFSAVFPFILVDDSGWQAIPWTVFVGFALSSIDHLAKAIEKPFENRVNDTAMTAISRTIEIDLRQMLGETELPPPIQPKNGYLM
jgi:ion channel-forming bestrophin family protein